MKRKLIGRIVLLAGLLAGGAVLHAQEVDGTYSAFSPYSIYGVGDISKGTTSFNASMAGVGVATRDNRFVNVVNPAAVTARDSLSVMADVSLAEKNNYFSQGGINSSNNIFNFNNFVISFPVYRRYLDVYLGIKPYSSVGYNVSHPITDPAFIGTTGNVTYTSRGNGSVNSLYLGAGSQLTRHLSVGVEGIYYFGKLNKATAMSFSNTSFRTINSGHELSLRGVTLKVGAQMDIPMGEMSTMTVGATYKLGTKISGYNKDYLIATISSASDTVRYNRDNLRDYKDRVKFADELGVGVSMRGSDKWSVEVDYIRSNAGPCGYSSVVGFKNESETVKFSSGVSQSVRVGASYVPNRNDIRYYMRRVAYRAGAYWDQAYYKVNGNNVNSYGITLGASFPTTSVNNPRGSRNHINVAVDLGQRGTKDNNLIRERFINFTVGVNIFDIWFIKPKYD
ncbi:MAG: hypothetical protein IJK96_04805 [Bacteroidales bacterium]|nr:hypothetical protein [Bacteroidales bacterium]